MSFKLSEEQAMLRDAAREFLAEKSPVSELRRLRDEKNPDGFSRQLWSGMAEMGWLGVLVPEEHGGIGFGAVGAGLISEAMGRSLVASPFLSSAVLAAVAIREGGTDAHKAEHLPKIASGERIYALAADERPRHDPAAIDASAVRDGNGFRLSGVKRHIPEGHAADAFVVSAMLDGEVALFLVEAKAEGASTDARALVDSRYAADLTLNDVKLDGGALMSSGEAAQKALDAALETGRACLSAELLGAGETAFDATLDYLKQRQQFGRVIGTFQGLQHRAAHLHSELELTRSLAFKALAALDAGTPDAPMWCAAAKAKATAAGRLSASEAIQMFGGVGMTDEFDIGFFYKRAQAAGEFLGDDRFHADRLAKINGY
ncbi:MAG: acyl-CoA dehydrogenase family protein [Maricaulaceae bacterium]|nr:acyl-CoA dehydrogenase family protein [Maricaulaceae bacterium]